MYTEKMCKTCKSCPNLEIYDENTYSISEVNDDGTILLWKGGF